MAKRSVSWTLNDGGRCVMSLMKSAPVSVKCRNMESDVEGLLERLRDIKCFSLTLVACVLEAPSWEKIISTKSVYRLKLWYCVIKDPLSDVERENMISAMLRSAIKSLSIGGAAINVPGLKERIYSRLLPLQHLSLAQFAEMGVAFDKVASIGLEVDHMSGETLHDISRNPIVEWLCIGPSTLYEASKRDDWGRLRSELPPGICLLANGKTLGRLERAGKGHSEPALEFLRSITLGDNALVTGIRISAARENAERRHSPGVLALYEGLIALKTAKTADVREKRRTACALVEVLARLYVA